MEGVIQWNEAGKRKNGVRGAKMCLAAMGNGGVRYRRVGC